MITPFSFTSFYPVTHKIQKKKTIGCSVPQKIPWHCYFCNNKKGSSCHHELWKKHLPRLNSRRGHVCSHLFRNEELWTTLAQHQSTLNFHHPNLLVGIHFSIASKAVCPNTIWKWKSQPFHFTVSRKRKPTRSISYHILPSVFLCGPLSDRMSGQKLDEIPAKHVHPTTY